MSLAKCIPGMVERGEITPEKGDEMAALYGELQRGYRQQYGDHAADAMASDETLKVLQRKALLAKRRALLQVRAQAAALADRAKAKGPSWLPERIKKVELRRQAVSKRAYTTMDEVLARFRRNVAGVVRNKAELIDLARERFGEASGSVSAKEMSEGFGTAAEMLRNRFNAAGGDIGKIDRWGLPQAHDSDRVRMAAGKGKSMEENYRAWRDAELPRWDLAKMIDQRTGQPFTADTIEAAALDVFKTLRSDGWAKKKAGAGGAGAMAGRRSERRFIIYKSADDWMASHAQFGRGTILDVMTGHIDGMSRDIAAMEILGPNPEATLRWGKDLAKQTGKLADDDGAAGEKGEGAANKAQSLWNEYTGANQRPGSRVLANVGSAVRAYETASKLGSAIFSAFFGDTGTQYTTARYNGLPFTKVMSNYLKLLNPANEEDRRFAIRLGAGAEGWAHIGSASARTMISDVSKEWASRLSEGILRASGMGRHTDAGRWATQLAIFGHMSDMADRDYGRLDGPFRDMLGRNGIDSVAWDSIRATPQEAARGAKWIFPANIADHALGDRLLELASTESDAAVPVADLETRAQFHELGRAGTVGGEIIRNSLLFKTFGVAMLVLHAKRIMQMSSWRQRVGYGLNFLISATLGGALTVQAKEILNGRDPRPMDNPGFWGAAFFQGGGFGIAGDLFQLAVEPRLAGWAKYIAGPTADTLDSVAKFGVTAFNRAAGIRSKTGKKANVGGAGVALLQRELPGSNLWYTRLAFQRLLLDRLSEATDLNYRQSWRAMRQRAHDQRSAYYWAPGAAQPARAPQISNAFDAPPPSP